MCLIRYSENGPHQLIAAIISGFQSVKFAITLSIFNHFYRVTDGYFVLVALIILLFIVELQIDYSIFPH